MMIFEISLKHVTILEILWPVSGLIYGLIITLNTTYSSWPVYGLIVLITEFLTIIVCGSDC